MTTTTVAVGECCPACGRRVPKPRATAPTASRFPSVTPAPGAEALLADHVRRRAQRRTTSRRGRYEHPDDYRLRRDHPDLVCFLHEAAAGGRVTRFYAAPECGRVMVEFAGPFGVFHPIAARTLDVATLEALAARIADGTVWRQFVDEVAAA